MTTDAPRIDVAAAHEQVASGRALLVCAYDDEEKCRSMQLAGSITLTEFQRQEADVDARQSIILYCA